MLYADRHMVNICSCTLEVHVDLYIAMITTSSLEKVNSTRKKKIPQRNKFISRTYSLDLIFSFMTSVMFCCRLLKDCPGFVFTPRSREELPPNFPAEIPGICYFLDTYLQGTNSKTWFQKKDTDGGETNFLGTPTGVD